jgi:hypothetical protein
MGQKIYFEVIRVIFIVRLARQPPLPLTSHVMHLPQAPKQLWYDWNEPFLSGPKWMAP